MGHGFEFLSKYGESFLHHLHTYLHDCDCACFDTEALVEEIMCRIRFRMRVMRVANPVIPPTLYAVRLVHPSNSICGRDRGYLR